MRAYTKAVRELSATVCEGLPTGLSGLCSTAPMRFDLTVRYSPRASLADSYILSACCTWADDGGRPAAEPREEDRHWAKTTASWMSEQGEGEGSSRFWLH